MFPFEIAPAAEPLPGEAVVMVHCSAGSTRQWVPLGAELTGYRAMPVSLIRHGRQDKWHGAGPMDLGSEAAGILGACEGLERFHLVGHSYGGAVALKVAMATPDRLLSLTLIEPSAFHLLGCFGERGDELRAEIGALGKAVASGVVTGDYRAGMAAFVDYWTGTGSWHALPDAQKDRLAQLAMHVAHHFHGLFSEQSPLDAYAAIGAPTLIVSGSRSPRPSQALSGLLAAHLPRAAHRVVAGAGHMSPLTHPAEVAALIAAHVRSNGWRKSAAHHSMAEASDRLAVRAAAIAPAQAA